MEVRIHSPLFLSFPHLLQVLNPRPALLSNYEVLQLLRELEADHIARTRIAQRLKKEEEDAAAASGHPPSPALPLTIAEKLRPIRGAERSVRLVKSATPFRNMYY